MMSLNPPAAWLLEVSLRVSAAIVLLGCLRPVLRRLVGSRTTACLWLLVAARLLWLWPVESRWSWPVPLAFLAWVTHETPAQGPAARVSVGPAIGESQTKPAVTPDAAWHRLVFPEKARSLRWDVLSLIWLSGLSVVTAHLVRGCSLVRRWAVRTLPGERDARLAQVFASIPPSLRRGVELRITGTLDVPTLVGIRRPQIWMPRLWLKRLNAEEIRHVLLHELGHARRGDLLAQWVCSLACCLHWFNPLVWMMARLARTDRELACDAWVLAQGGENSEREFPAAYGHTLIKIVGQMRGSTPWQRSPAAVAMAAGKRHLTLRVREIGAFCPVSAWRGWTVLGLAAMIMATFTVSRAAQTVESPATTPGQVPGPDHSAPALETAATPVPATPPPSPADYPKKEQQIEVATKWIEFSDAAVAELKASRAEFSSSDRFVGPIIAAFDQVRGDAEVPSEGSSSVQVNPPEVFEKFVRRINQIKGVDLLSAPRVTTRSGQKATVELVRELIYPTKFERNEPGSGKPEQVPTDFKKTNLGLTEEIEPNFSSRPGMIDLIVSGKLVELKGWNRLKDGKPLPETEGFSKEYPQLIQEIRDGKPVGKEVPPWDAQPVIGTQTMKNSVTVASGSTLMICLTPEENKVLKKKVIVICFVTATAIDTSSATAVAAPQGTPEDSEDIPVATDNKYPFGIPVKRKPGFVMSPFAPDAGYVDVHGFKRGQKVRDPYTSKIFLVP